MTHDEAIERLNSKADLPEGYIPVTVEEQNLVEFALESIHRLHNLETLLMKVDVAYQGVGDFEGTGKNMVSIIDDVRSAMAGVI